MRFSAPQLDAMNAAILGPCQRQLLAPSCSSLEMRFNGSADVNELLGSQMVTTVRVEKTLLDQAVGGRPQ